MQLLHKPASLIGLIIFASKEAILLPHPQFHNTYTAKDAIDCVGSQVGTDLGNVSPLTAMDPGNVLVSLHGFLQIPSGDTVARAADNQIGDASGKLH